MTEPKGLGPAGRRLWRNWMAGNEPDPGDEVLLEHAARTADELLRLAEALAGAEVTVEGSTGQPRANPLLDEVRRHRASLAGLLRQLAPVEQTRGGHTSELAREAARARWSRHKPRLVS